MKPVSELDADSILNEDVFVELFEILDPIKRTRLKVNLLKRAKTLGVKTYFEEILSGYSKAEREIKQQQMRDASVCTLDNYTNFEGSYDRMFCGGWIATDSGIYSMAAGGKEDVACYHPILPIERLKNLETGDEQIKLAYKRNNRWNEIIVPKTMITSAGKIVGLSSKGISVTSENAKLLVKYLADVENGNDDYIGVQYSTSKLGWIEGDFIPYDENIIFDGDGRFKQAFESVTQRGNEHLWKQHIKDLRATNRIEIKFLLAASFSSALVQLLGGLPFIVDLWGETEGGKTVSLMVAASVWANPDENRFIGDFKTTDVALEAKADMLNNLPMLLDDTSKTSARIRDNFEGIVYDLCSGKGKSRSNKELGVNRENRWKNTIICNGEKPLSSYVVQGGAINRILEVECGEQIYSDPGYTAELLKKNYGYAGKEFIEIIKKIGVVKLNRMQKEFLEKLKSDDKMQKQSLALSIVLTADKIVTEQIFKDKSYITLEEARSVLVDKNEVSDNERCYAYILDKVAMNNQRFIGMNSVCEQWGVVNEGYAIFYNSAFDQICKDGGFSKKSFLSWANKKKLIQTQGDRLTKVKKVNGSAVRCIWIKIDERVNEHGFMSVEEGQEELPFK
ncbi:MAG: DUF927 domain-containing protein [Eubacteriales bacterium]